MYQTQAAPSSRKRQGSGESKIDKTASLFFRSGFL